MTARKRRNRKTRRPGLYLPLGRAPLVLSVGGQMLVVTRRGVQFHGRRHVVRRLGG